MNGKHTVQRGDQVVRALAGQTIDLTDEEALHPDGTPKFPGRLEAVNEDVDARAVERAKAKAEADAQAAKDEQERLDAEEADRLEREESARAQALEKGEVVAGSDELTAAVRAKAEKEAGTIPGTGPVPAVGAVAAVARPSISKRASSGTGLVPPKDSQKPK
jgi:hypothetical protein